ncbi:MAG: family 43 glycosylhydrolase [Spirochaetales bacterium]|nr:family 43 glycosylhydrolase [Spirochaetales bacterium]
MRRKPKFLQTGALMLFFISVNSFAENPIVQTLYTADPAPMVYDDKLYVYTTHDEDQIINNFFTMNDWRVYSTSDMANWVDHGSPLAYTDFSWASGSAWAAQCVPRNGKFYLYVPINQKNGGNAIGVAVSDSPTGPFKDAIGRPLMAAFGYIDPTVFIDDDGQAYLYWGNPNLWYVKLNNDMISYSGGIQQIPLTTASFGTRTGDAERSTTYEEGPWFYKRNNLYYMIFAGGPISEHIGYSTSNGPTGPWTYRGKIMPTQGGSFTNHPGVAHYKNRSYLFYHNAALPGGGGFHRSVCVEEFTYRSDGTIPTINMTSSGPPQIENLNPYETVEAETICLESGIETEKCDEGGMNVANIENGDWIKIKGVDFDSGASGFEARVASNTSGGKIELRLGSQTGTLIGTCTVSGTGGWQNWTTVSTTVSGASGLKDLFLCFTGGSDFLFNLNWWRFTGSENYTPTPEPTPVVTPAAQQDPVWNGGPYSFNGSDEYTSLPAGITSDLYDFTIACKVNINSISSWTRIFDFGSSTEIFMMLTMASGETDLPYFAITLTGNSGEQGINSSIALKANTLAHIAITKQANVAIMYINGEEAGSNTAMTLNPADMGNTANNYIGRSQWPNDPYMEGSVDDFRIYNRALSDSEIADLANNQQTKNLGDVNDDQIVNIVDALLMAQYYVSMPISGTFIEANGDVNCDSIVNIVDALLTAQYYVKLIEAFC